MAFLKLIGILALFIGLAFGMIAKLCLSDSVGHPERPVASGYTIMFSVLAFYLLLSVLIMMIRSKLWGATPTQIRLVWFLSFSLSSIAAPLIVWVASR